MQINDFAIDQFSVDTRESAPENAIAHIAISLLCIGTSFLMQK